MDPTPLLPLGAEFASGLPFELDGFQTAAMQALEEDGSVLVAAPTGSGKTVVADFASWLALRRGAKCFYTTPLKALSNQKFGDLIARHGAGNVGLLTGDNTINGEAPLVVMTTEVLRNMIYERSQTLEGLHYVVMDEVHYLQDPYRGAVWEEVLIHLSTDVRVVCLSATVSNADQVGEWLETLRGPTAVVVEHERPVELRNMAMVGEELFPLLAEPDAENVPKKGRRRGQKVNSDLARVWARGVAAGARYGHAGRKRRPGDRVYTPSRIEVAEVLEREKMLPAICFVFSRVGCDKAVESCIFADLHLTSEADAERIVEFAEMRASNLDPEDLRALRFSTFVDGLRRGVAAHHAGMLPIFKETVEELFAAGLVKIVFATETLALGINMPAKTVVIERLTKFTGERHELLTPTDYTQLTGRAGRRGIDELGFAVVLFSPWVPLDRIMSLATVRAYELSSSFRTSYNMAVNLVRNHDPEAAMHLLNSSFAQFVTDREVVLWERRLEEKDREVASLREQAHCNLGDVMEYRRLREAAVEAQRTQRGGPEVQEAFGRLAPGDVVWGDKLGKALVCEQPRMAKGGGPQVSVMTTDRKLRRVSPRDFRTAPEPLGRIALRGQSWRAAKVRKNLADSLKRLNVSKPRGAGGGARTADLVRAYEEHPVHACPEASEHLQWAERLDNATGEASSLRKRVRRRRGTIGQTFERVLNVLRELGYVEEWGLSGKGRLLTRVYNEADLLVVECLDRGWLAGLDAEELAAVVSLFVYEARGRDEPESAPTPHLARYQRRIMNLHKQLSEVEQREGLELLKEPDGGVMGVIYEWAAGSSLETLLEDRAMSAGDFVRVAKQVIDLLQQLRQVVDDGDLADTLAGSVKAVQRGVVAYSSVV